MKKLMSGFFAAALALALPLTANAQEAVTPQDQEECRATVTPIQAGEKVSATATFDSPFGKIAALQAPEGTNIALHTEKDEERTEMAAEERPLGAEEPVGAEERPMGEEDPAGAEERPLGDDRPVGVERDQLTAENQSEFWLVAKDVPAGTYEVTLENDEGKTCTTEITIEDETVLETDIDAGIDADAGIGEEVDEETEDQDNTDW